LIARCTIVLAGQLAVGVASADAQWLFAAYGGAAVTGSSDVQIEKPESDTALRFDDTPFEGRSFDAPVYYGYRAGRMISARRGLFVAAEFIHAKAYATVTQAYGSGVLRGAPVTQVPMSEIVGRFAMSHGLNFLLADIGIRRPLRPRVTATLIAGAGPMLPHVESEIDGIPHDGYELGGTGIQVAAGADVRVSRHVSLLAEYKWTRAMMRVTIAGGEASLSPTSHHLAVGVAAAIGGAPGR
jgi:hypothetical protein